MADRGVSERVEVRLGQTTAQAVLSEDEVLSLRLVSGQEVQTIHKSVGRGRLTPLQLSKAYSSGELGQAYELALDRETKAKRAQALADAVAKYRLDPATKTRRGHGFAYRERETGLPFMVLIRNNYEVTCRAALYASEIGSGPRLQGRDRQGGRWVSSERCVNGYIGVRYEWRLTPRRKKASRSEPDPLTREKRPATTIASRSGMGPEE